MPTPAKISVDFSNVKDGGRSDYIPPGDYLVKVIGCELKSKKDDKTRKYLNWLLQVVEPSKYKGKKIYFVTSLVEESLWNLRNLLVDMLGEDKVPKKVVDIPVAKIVKAQKVVGVTVEDDEYNGKTKSKVNATFSLADWKTLAQKAEDSDEEEESEDEDEVEEEEEEEEEAPKTRKEKTSKKAKAEEEEDEDEDEDMDEIDVEDI